MKKVKKKITFKKIMKYTTNILAILNAILIGLSPIWNIPYIDKIIATIGNDRKDFRPEGGDDVRRGKRDHAPHPVWGRLLVYRCRTLYPRLSR